MRPETLSRVPLREPTTPRYPISTSYEGRERSPSATRGDARTVLAVGNARDACLRDHEGRVTRVDQQSRMGSREDLVSSVVRSRLPPEIRDAPGLKEGDSLAFEEEKRESSSPRK